MRKILPTFKFEKNFWEKGYYVIGVDEVGRGALAGPLYVGAVCFKYNKNVKTPHVFSAHGEKKWIPTTRKKESSMPYFLTPVGSSSNFSRTPPVVKNRYLRFQMRTGGNEFKTESDKINGFDINSIEKLGIDDSKRLNAKQRLLFSKIIKKITFAAEVDHVSVSYINRRGIVKSTQAAMRKVIKQLLKKLNGKKIFLLSDAFYIKYLRGIGLKNEKAIVRGDQKSISIAAASIIAKVERDHNMYKLHHKYPIYCWDKNKGYGTKQHISAIKKYGKSKLHRDLFLRKII